MIVNALGVIALPYIYLPITGHEGKLGIGGVALAFVLAGYANMMLSLYYLHKKVGNFYNREIIVDFIKVVFAASIMGVAAHYLLYLFDPLVQASGGKIAKGLFPQTVLSILISIFIYFALTLMMKIRESQEILAKVKRVLAKS